MPKGDYDYGHGEESSLKKHMFDVHKIESDINCKNVIKFLVRRTGWQNMSPSVGTRWIKLLEEPSYGD